VARYSLFIKKSAAKELESIQNKRDRLRIVERIRALADEPRPPGSRKLSGRERYRLREGVYRIVYSIKDDTLTVWVVKIGHRRDVYRGRN